MSDANEIQVAGDHYKSQLQHWDWVVACGMNYFQANATKYVTRHKKKNGAEDLKKAAHYTMKLLELLTAGNAIRTDCHLTFDMKMNNVHSVVYAMMNDLDNTQQRILSLILGEGVHDSDIAQLREALSMLHDYTQNCYGDGHDLL